MLSRYLFTKQPELIDDRDWVRTSVFCKLL